MSSTTRPRRIEGYAIVSTDGMLANAVGIMPEELKFDVDQRFFAQGLDGVDAEFPEEGHGLVREGEFENDRPVLLNVPE